MLIDQFHRVHDYLRISLTDVCNFRCHYCMPEDVHFMPHTELMQTEEIIEISKVFVNLGVKKIRLTGGEPLVRKDADRIILELSKLPIELTLTTNGSLIENYLDVFKNSSIKSLNISIDSLKNEKFNQIVKRNQFEKVWNNILMLIENDFKVKLNVVLMKNLNEDEILDFVELTKKFPFHIRFIEFMPFEGNLWNSNQVVAYQEILDKVSSVYEFEKLKDDFNDTAKKFKVKNHLGTFAIITTMSNPFCEGCNRIRLTADGKVKNCLFSENEVDILTNFRKGENIENIIKEVILSKKKSLGGQWDINFEQLNPDEIKNRSMVKIGG